MPNPFSEFAQRLRDFPGPEAFNTLALELFALQFESIAPYRQFCLSRQANPSTVHDWRQIPAIPSTSFKDFDLTSLPAEKRSFVFHSSGTTSDRPSRHFHSAESIALYEDSLHPWFLENFFPDVPAADFSNFDLRFLTPPPDLAPHSSLVHMFETIRRRFPAARAEFVGELDRAGAWTLFLPRAAQALNTARPVAILGTAFSFVHLLDYFSSRSERCVLPAGSRALETGGYKGRSRSLPKAELHRLISHTLGLPADRIHCEYGMSELSSQAYQSSNSGAFHFPPWARTRIISPETALEVEVGETGLLQIFDLANVWSVLAIQTEDLATRLESGFALIGRSPAAAPRGCSLLPAEFTS